MRSLCDGTVALAGVVLNTKYPSDDDPLQAPSATPSITAPLYQSFDAKRICPKDSPPVIAVAASSLQR